jgi:hypothetical protein
MTDMRFTYRILEGKPESRYNLSDFETYATGKDDIQRVLKKCIFLVHDKWPITVCG